MSQDDVHEAAVRLGRVMTPKKRVAIMANLAKSNGRPLKPLASFPCRCHAGVPNLDPKTHRWDCPLRRAIEHRMEKGQPLT